MDDSTRATSRLAGRDTVVTGGAGAIGSRLVRRLLAEGAASVRVVDDLSSGYRWLLPEDPRVELIVADISESVPIDPVPDSPVVFHLAALFANQNSVDHPLRDLEVNGRGTLATLLWAAEHRAERLVYASAGCSIAGHDVEGPISEELPVSLRQDTPYQITKALGEFYCNYFLDQVSTVRCRFFNSYGPGEVPGGYRNVIPNFIWAALHDRPLTITGTGQETRDFIYVDDLVDGLIRAALTPGAHGRCFNLGTGIETTVNDLAAAILRLTGSGSQIRYAPRRPWDRSTHRQAEITRARRGLGFAPATSLEEGLAETVRWFREHHDRIAAEHGE